MNVDIFIIKLEPIITRCVFHGSGNNVQRTYGYRSICISYKSSHDNKGKIYMYSSVLV